MLAGISTACFYPQYTEDALRTLCDQGVESTEIFINCSQELEPDYLRQLKKNADDSGVTILSLHPFTSGMEPMLFFSKYDRRFQEGLDMYKRYYEAANLLGAQIVVFHGGLKHANLERDFYFSCYSRIMEDAHRSGVQLCHENVSRCVGYSPAFLCDLVASVPGTKIVLDTKQAVRSGQRIEDFVDLLGPHIAHIHISDHNIYHNCLPPGRGVFNIPEFLSALGKHGFDGGVIVELYRENFDGIVEIMQGYQHISHIISTLA